MSSSVAVPATPVEAESRPRFQRIYVWEKPVRIFHWVNALCILVLFFTGLYIGSPILSSNGEPFENFLMGRMRQIHFATAFIFIIFFLMRVFWFFVGNKYARSGYPYVWRPSWWKDMFRQAGDYVRLRFGHRHLGHNALAGAAYSVIISFGWLQMFTGLALYSESNPGGFWDGLVGWVIPLFGGSFRTHMWHHMFAWVFIWFAIIHIYIVILDSGNYRNGLIGSMITGNKFVREDEVRDVD